jgi:hypothetical protein
MWECNINFLKHWSIIIFSIRLIFQLYCYTSFYHHLDCSLDHFLIFILVNTFLPFQPTNTFLYVLPLANALLLTFLPSNVLLLAKFLHTYILDCEFPLDFECVPSCKLPLDTIILELHNYFSSWKNNNKVFMLWNMQQWNCHNVILTY